VDPKYQHDETFASTVTGIEELRKAHHDDWPEWRRTLVNAARAGARMEQELRDVEAAIEQCARRTAVSTLANKVAALEDGVRRRRGLISWFLNHFWQIAAIVITAYLAHRWH
jgi:hypothetical protein